ncbi:MAG: hypothetical protein HY718_05360 [Planctomycetes bacterium]|nr:hypothetical protein [Planctomycetota bacterium]
MTTVRRRQLLGWPRLLSAAGVATIAATVGFPDASAASTAPAASQPAGRVVEFHPNVRIDYRRRQVEVDAKVTLREGSLELFACSPGTREYESIVVVLTRPLFVFQALGLLGLTPGHPLRMLPDGAIEPADGEPIEAEVRYQADGKLLTVPIEDWLRLSGQRGPLPRQPWVFSGSFPIEGGAIAADEEGTVVAVVDFASAVVALPHHHTADNADLWLEPNTPAIPPVGTPCTLILRRGPWRLRLDEIGRLYLAGRPITLTELARRLRGAVQDAPGVKVDLDVAPGCAAEDRQRVSDVLGDLGIKPLERITSRPSSAAASRPKADADDSTALLRWAGGRLSTTRPDDHPNAETPPR